MNNPLRIYKILQIDLSDELIAAVNNPDAPTPEAYYTYLRTMRPTTDQGDILDARSMYVETMEIVARNLDEVFEVGNVGPTTRITYLTHSRRSISVGDIIIDDEGSASSVASFGFVSLPNW
jgi:hypothetical protein